jgi:hypothetical protein
MGAPQSLTFEAMVMYAGVHDLDPRETVRLLLDMDAVFFEDWSARQPKGA